MKRLLASIVGTALAVAPVVGKAQTAPAPATSEPSAAQPAPTNVAAPAPAPAPAPKVTITPYGFVLLQAFWNDGPFSAKDYPGQALLNGDGGSFLMSARGTRFGFKVGLPDDPLTGAKINGVVELDTKGGYVPSTFNTTTTTTCTGTPPVCTSTSTTSSQAASTAWYNSLARLRLGYVTAAWEVAPQNKVVILVGQDWRVVAPLAPTSIAFGYDQIFTQAGNLNVRDPQIKATYDGAFGAVGLNITGAMLSPQDTFLAAPTGGVDYGAGNRSRMPNFEARVAANFRDGGKKLAEVGLAGGIGWRRYNVSGGTSTMDTTTHILAVDAVFNVPFVTLQGEAYASDGMEDSYTPLISNAVATTSTGTGAAARITSITNIQSQGYWAQAVLKPIDWVNIPVGYGMAQARYHGIAAFNASTRIRNSQFHTGLLLNTASPWKFGFEFTHTVSGYGGNTAPAKANQYVLASKLDF